MRNPVEISTAGPHGSPPPSNESVDLATSDDDALTETSAGTEVLTSTLAEILADVLQVEQVPIDSHFFDDLGADSLVMAHFCARVRKRENLPPVSMKDVYPNPTIRKLTTRLGDAARAAPGPVAPAPVEPVTPVDSPVTPVGNRQYLLCGTLQLLAFLGYSYLAGHLVRAGYTWISTASGPAEIYLRAVAFSTGGFLAVCTVPILAKWALIGRWKPQEIQLWSLAYVRFWLVKTLLRSNPLVLFAGTPLYPFYLRALGARIGRGAAIFSRNPPVCTDLFTVGAGTVVSRQSSVQCYRAHAGRIQTGPVTLGKDVYLGEKTVLDINTSMGDDSQLGHTSALHSGQAVPSGQRWHGSPAVRTEVNYARVAPARCGRPRQIAYSCFLLFRTLFLLLPLGFGLLYVVLTQVPPLAVLLGPGVDGLQSPAHAAEFLLVSLALFASGLLLSLLAAGVLPRLLSLLLTPGLAYPLYGFRYGVHRAIVGLTNRKFLTYLFGDSSAIVHYLRWLGYDLGLIKQTGVNFGLEMRQDDPHLTSVGSGTMVADGLYVLNAEYSSTSFKVSRVSIGQHSFLGNQITYPVDGRAGDDCLLATKVMVPIEGKVHEGVGLLGSPYFEIPRSVARDSRFDHLATGDELRRSLARKNRYDARSMGVFLTVRWLHSFLLLAISLGAVDLFGTLAELSVAALFALGLVVTTGYYALVERALIKFRRLRPRYCSVYDPYFWWHERWWKSTPYMHLHAFDGTPFMSVVSRLRGARVGRRVFDDGCVKTEPTLITIGDGCTINPGSILQCHSQEDGTFKSDHITIGDRCTIGPGALVHYGTTMGDDATLAADSFLMKGEQVPPLARWGGNPAREIPA